MPDYLTADQITARLKAAAANPNALATYGELPNVTPGDAANGITGRKPPYVQLTAPSSPVTPRTVVVITGGVHAREWAPPDALVSFIDAMVATDGTKPVQYPTWTQTTFPARPLPNPAATPIVYPGFTVDAGSVRNIFQNVNLYIAPLVNPDGREYSRKPTAGFNWWRKNRNGGGGAACLDDHGTDQSTGVDINRNFDIAFNFRTLFAPAYVANVATADTVCPGVSPLDHRDGETYAGAAKMSEPEVKNVDWLQQRDGGARVFVDVHSAGPDIIYPWGIANANQTTDNKQNINNPTLDGTRDATYAEYIPAVTQSRLITVGGRMQQKILDTQSIDGRAFADFVNLPKQQRFTATYPVAPSGQGLYVSTGGCDDYHFSRQFTTGLGPSYPEAANPPELFAYTIECGSESQGLFWPDFTHEFPKIEREIHAALWGLLSYVASPAFSAPVFWPFGP